MWIVTGGFWTSRFEFIQRVVVIMERIIEDEKRSECLLVSAVDEFSLLTMESK